MPYENIPGVKGSYVDGSIVIPRNTTQPRILVVGPAKSGLTNEPFTVRGSSAAETEFTADSPVLRGVHEALAQGATNVAVMRSGGKQGQVVITDSAGDTLTITPESRDDEILDRYTLIIEAYAGANRIIIYDLTQSQFVYDSQELLAFDDGILDVVDAGLALVTIGDKSTPTLSPKLSALVAGSFSPSVASVSLTAGADGINVSAAERYAALNASYHNLDFKDGDLIAPVDVYIDAANIVDQDAVNRVSDASGATTDIGSYGVFFLGAPAKDSDRDLLGYVWQYVYRGRLYTYFTDVEDYASGTKTAATLTDNTDLVWTAATAGKGGNGIIIGAASDTSGGLAITAVESGTGQVTISIDFGGDTFADNAAFAAAATPLIAAINLSSGKALSSILGVAGGSTAIASAASLPGGALTGGQGGGVLTHADLTGDTVPSAVSTRWAAAVDAEFREVNFAHQLASFCETASVNWKAIHGAISVKAPTAFSRIALSDWVGTMPEYSDNSSELYIDSAADNGSGVLGIKLMAGQADATAGYRASRITNGAASDSLAYGGLIKTFGAALPNGRDWTYGISDGDEATDSNGAPVDIGRHIHVTTGWPILTNAYNGGTTYRGDIAASFLGKIATLPENVEPIGANGSLAAVSSAPRIHSAQHDNLAQLRFVGIRPNELGDGTITIVRARTAAHPSSDYAKISTIRCVNKHLEDMRSICRPYIGQAFTAQNLVSLQASLDLYLLEQRRLGFNQGAVARLSYTRADKVQGRLTITLRMVPPFSLESITVSTSIAADETEL
jgi:hypothetical protein